MPSFKSPPAPAEGMMITGRELRRRGLQTLEQHEVQPIRLRRDDDVLKDGS